MNDRCKFRIWDKERKNMFCPKDKENDFIEIDCDGELHGYDTCLWVGGVNSIPMQCTGLKDKNGTLIYEGDIIETLHLDPVRRGNIEWSDKYLQWFIDFSRVYGKAEYNYYCEELCGFNSKDIEVIGNVYENPELLEVGNENS